MLTPSKRAHSSIGASGMYRWEPCPGSVALSEDLPDVESPYALEGTLAHDVAEMILNGEEHRFDADLLPKDMIPAVMQYVDYVRALQKNPGFEVLVEHRFSLSLLFPNLFGTADAVAYNDFEQSLHVIDYKHGKGVFVDPVDNPQLQYYALGCLLTLPHWRPETVTLTVVQPRFKSEHGVIRHAHYEAMDLIDTFAARLIRAAERTTKPNAELKAGKHCIFCKAKGICPELARDKEERKLAQAREDFEVIEE